MVRSILIPWLVLVATSAAAQPADRPVPTDREVTAVFADERPRIDGHLDELLWTRIEPVTVFTQVWPETGSPATEDTEVRVAYDEDHLYFAFRNLDREPHLIRAQNLERGGRNDCDDHVYIGLDTYRDGRNAYLFEMNALGTQDDATVTDEALSTDSFSWDAVFRSETVIHESGWSMEVAIPFRQLRFPEGDDLAFGLMLSRTINRKNERVTWPAIGLERGSSFAALATVSQYGVLRGLRGVRRGYNVEVKPYAVSGLQQSRPDLAAPTGPVDGTADAGLDVKVGLTSGVTLDLTVNTDFAQVEADNVQINLTRFNLFYPEKREFFLERSGLFDHGSLRSVQTFFSRRIGLEEDILAGARLTGQVGPVSGGLLNIETGPGMGDLFGGGSANNTVARLRAEVLPRTTVGGIVTNLQRDSTWNRAVGVDGGVRFGPGSVVDAWFTRVWDADPALRSSAGRLFAQLAGESYSLGASYTGVGRTYAPALGFVNRRDQRRYKGVAVYRPRVDWGAAPFVRRLSARLDGEAVTGQDGGLQTTDLGVGLSADLYARDGAGLDVTRTFERLDEPFRIREGEVVAPGDYAFVRAALSGETDSSRPLFASAVLATGGFFGGTRTDLGLGVGWRQSRHLALEAGLSHRVVDVGNGPFSATTGSVSALTSFSRTLFGRTLLQYDNFSGAFRANVRLNWIHTPGSDLFVVFNTAYGLVDDGSDPFDPRRTLVFRDRVAVAKLTYLVLL